MVYEIFFIDIFFDKIDKFCFSTWFNKESLSLLKTCL